MSILKLTRAIADLTVELNIEKQEVRFLTAANDALTLKLAVAKASLAEAETISRQILGKVETLQERMA